MSDAGRAELARWIAEPLTGRGSSLANGRLRDLAVKVRVAGYADAAVVCAQAAELRAQHAGCLEVYRALEKRQFPDPATLTGATLHQHLVLRGGIRAEESAIDWLDEVEAALR